MFLNRPDPIVFLPLPVNTSDRFYDDFICLFFLHAHREASALANELLEEIMAKSSDMRISVPLDLTHTECLF